MGFLVLSLFGCSSSPTPTEVARVPDSIQPPATGHLIRFSRYITVESCKRRAKCTEPVAKEIEKANVALALTPFAQSFKHGLTAVDHLEVFEGEVPFRSEIRISKAQDGYYIYIRFKSGSDRVRVGQVKTLKVLDMAKLPEIVLEDEPIANKGRTLKAQLVVGPTLPVDLSTP